MKYLKTDFISLQRCHPIYLTCGSNSYEIKKAVIQGRLLSGRVKFERLQRHYVSSMADGLCSLNICHETSLAHPGDLESFLFSCPSLSDQRQVSLQSIESFTEDFPELSFLISECLTEDSVQFMLDCSVMSKVIEAVQSLGDYVLQQLFKVTIVMVFTRRDKRFSK